MAKESQMARGSTRDVQFAFRQLLLSPGFSAATVLTLALGIGATTTIFSVVYTAMLRPLPFPNADRLIQIVQVLEPMNASQEALRAGLTPNQFAELQEHSTTLTAVGGYAHSSLTLSGVDVPVRLSGASITAGVLGQLGVQPALGRSFAPQDSEPGADPVVLLSHDTWVRYFGANTGLIGRRIALGEVQPVVVGVMPRGFGFPSLANASLAKASTDQLTDAPEFWMPRPLFAHTPQRGGGFSLLQAFAILREGATPEQAAAEIRQLISPLPEGRRATLEVVSAQREMSRRMEPVLTLFQGGVLLIFLIACINATNLLLTRAAHKRRETAIRVALGASRSRIVREYVAESLTLALTGGALGCLLAYALAQVLRTLPPHLLPRLSELRIDAAVTTFALALAVGSGLLVGLVTGLRAGGAPSELSAEALRGMRVTPSRRLRPSSVAVVIEIAATMVLIAGGALLINSFVKLMQVDTGVDGRGLVTFRVALPGESYSSPERRDTYVRELLGRVRALPDVEAATASSYALTGGPIGFYRTLIDGQEIADARVWYHFVAPEFFTTLGVSLLQGRDFIDADWRSVATSVVVNEEFARRYLSNGPAAGRTLTFGDWAGLEIVGVARNFTLRPQQPPQPTIYIPADGRASLATPALIVRSRTQAPAAVSAVREVMRQMDATVAAYDVATVDQILAHAAAPAWLYSLVATASGLIALALAAVGLYGILAYTVSTRTQEFGIRIALGARNSQIVGSVMREGLIAAAMGIGLGLIAAYNTTQLLEGLLFGVTPQEPQTLVLATAMFLVVVGAASYIPSRRATRIDVSASLRAE
jgi:putative ABC transport system permease protein